MTLAGGRAAEEIIFGKDNITTGASSDLEKATEMTLSMIGIFGMDEKVGLLNYNVLSNRNLGNDEILLIRAKEILDGLYSETINILSKYKDELGSLAENLIKKEVLNEKEINDILAKI